MKMRILLAICIVSLAVCCKTKIEYEDKFVPVLYASDIYYADSVRNYLAKYKDAHKEVADGYVKQAAELAAANPDRAIYAAKRAVTLYPSKDNYLVLAERLKSRNDLSELSMLYNLLGNKQYAGVNRYEYVFGEPGADIVYENFLYSVLTGSYMDLFFEGADKLKASIREKLVKEPRLQMDRSSVQFQNILVLLMSEEETEAYLRKPEIFAAFLHSVTDSSAAAVIDEENIYRFKYPSMNERGDPEGFDIDSKYLSYHYLYEKRTNADFYPGYVNFLKRFSLNNNVHVVLYAIDTSAPASPEKMRHIYYRLVTYGKNADIIDNKIVASQAGDILNTATINRNQLEISENKRIWEKPYRYNDFDNELQGIEKIKTSGYTILDNGKIEAVRQP